MRITGAGTTNGIWTKNGLFDFLHLQQDCESSVKDKKLQFWSYMYFCML